VLFGLVPFVGIVRLIPPLKTLGAILIRLVLPERVMPEGPYVVALKKRQLGRLALVSAFVILIAGVLASYFESGARGASIHGFGDAVWWSAATATTVANQLYPVTTGGEIVAFALMVYAICIVAYLMSSLASILVAGDQQTNAPAPPKTPSDDARMVQLTPHEIEVLRAILARLEHPRSDEPR
jgi:voltage-gated potassium channel